MVKHIKDLKDLRALRIAECYRHSGPKGPEENKRRFFPSANAGEGNPLACACGMRGPKPYGEGGGFSPPVARGPVPRDCWSARAMARDRPSPYGEGGVFYRSAGACPPRAPSANYVFRSFRTYMSIEKRAGTFSRSFRSLIKTRTA